MTTNPSTTHPISDLRRLMRARRAEFFGFFAVGPSGQSHRWRAGDVTTLATIAYDITIGGEAGMLNLRMDALSCAFESLPLIQPLPLLPDYAADSWHPEDYTQPGDWPFFAAGPTRSYVEWLAFDKENTPAGDQSEETWASLVDAYRHLPHKLAVESVILAHVPYVHKMVYKWMRTVLGLDAERKELRGRQLVLMERAGIKTKKKGGGATIAEDLFSVGLLTLVETAPRLREVGRRENWDDWDAPGHMAHYLGVAASNAIWDYFDAEKVDREHVLAYLKKFHVGSTLSLLPPARKPLDGDTVPIDDDKGYQFTPMKALSWPVGGQSDTTPQLDRAVSAQPDDAQETAHQRQGRYLPYHKLTPATIAETREVLNRTCRDVKDRLLLTMRREGVATEEEMGEWLGLRRSQVNRRLCRLHEGLEEAFGLRNLPACKRASRRPTDLELLSNGQSEGAAKEAILGLPDGDLFNQLLTQMRKGLLAEVQMAARLGWTRDQLERRLYVMREVSGSGRCSPF